MKKLVYLFSLLAMASVVIITGCKKDDEPVPPTITLISGAGFTVSDGPMYINEPFTVGWNVTKGDKNLQTFSVTINGANLTAFNQGSPLSISGGSYSDTLWNITADPNPGTYNYTFTVTDKNNQSASFTITITVVNTTATAFGADIIGQFYHVQGSLKGAYDLVNDVEVAAAGPETDKDMKNTDPVGPFTGSWEAGTSNTTMFVKDNSYDYTLGIPKEAEYAYSNGTPSASATSTDGDIYITKLRGAHNYAVIKIVTVDAADNTCTCTNTGKISFNYKK